MPTSLSPKNLRNQRGQGLIEYLIIVALMSVAAIVTVRTISQNLNARFTEVAFALQGKKQSVSTDTIDSSVQKKDLGNFIDGVGSTGKNGSGKGSGSGSGSHSGSASGASSSFASGFGGGVAQWSTETIGHPFFRKTEPPRRGE